MASTRRQDAQPHLVAFGRRLASLRLERGMTQENLSERTGLSPAVLSEVENGRRDVRISALWLLAGGLDVTLADLVADL